MDILTPKKLKIKNNEEERLHKERTLKALRVYAGVNKKFQDFQIKIKLEKQNIIEDFREFTEEYQDKKSNLDRQLQGLKQEIKNGLQPLVEKERELELKIKEQKKLNIDYKILSHKADEDERKNQKILDDIILIKKENDRAKEEILNSNKNLKQRKEFIETEENQWREIKEGIQEYIEKSKFKIKEKERELNLRQNKQDARQGVLDIRELELKHRAKVLLNRQVNLNNAFKELKLKKYGKIK